MRLSLTGSPCNAIQDWKRSRQDEFFANRKPLVKALDKALEGLFSAQEVKEVDPLLEWKSNLADLLKEKEALPGLAAVARELGYGALSGEELRDTHPPGPAEPLRITPKPKKLRGRARVKQMIKESCWDWKGSSLDPKFKRPRISLKRKKEGSSESGSSSQASSVASSEQEDLFPEEAQARHISRKCPGLLTRYAVKEARKRLMTNLGEDGEVQKPLPVFVRYYRQICAHSGASTPMKREYLTLAVCLDSIIEGSILKCLDVGVQRLKSLEQMSQGMPAHVANRLELVPQETGGLASTEESRTITQEQRREDKVRTSWSQKGKGKPDLGWPRTSGEDVVQKGDKGGKSGKGKDPKGKPLGKWRIPKGGNAIASEVVAVKD